MDGDVLEDDLVAPDAGEVGRLGGAVGGGPEEHVGAVGVEAVEVAGDEDGVRVAGGGGVAGAPDPPLAEGELAAGGVADGDGEGEANREAFADGDVELGTGERVVADAEGDGRLGAWGLRAKLDGPFDGGAEGFVGDELDAVVAGREEFDGGLEGDLAGGGRGFADELLVGAVDDAPLDGHAEAVRAVGERGDAGAERSVGLVADHGAIVEAGDTGPVGVLERVEADVVEGEADASDADVEEVGLAGAAGDLDAGREGAVAGDLRAGEEAEVVEGVVDVPLSVGGGEVAALAGELKEVAPPPVPGTGAVGLARENPLDDPPGVGGAEGVGPHAGEQLDQRGGRVVTQQEPDGLVAVPVDVAGGADGQGDGGGEGEGEEEEAEEGQEKRNREEENRHVPVRRWRGCHRPTGEG